MRLFSVLAIVAGLIVAVVGCDKKDEGDNAAGSESTQAASEGSATDEGKGTTEASDKKEAPAVKATPAKPASPCPEKTQLVIEGIDYDAKLEGVAGPIVESTGFANLSTSNDSFSLSALVADYEIEPGQFGWKVPVGIPKVPDGKLIFLFSLHGETLSPGVYSEEYDDTKPHMNRITNISLFHGSDRILPIGNHTVEITKVTKDELCGTITAIGETKLQKFPTVVGTFKLPIKE